VRLSHVPTIFNGSPTSLANISILLVAIVIRDAHGERV
jgi:hypothetical protein